MSCVAFVVFGGRFYGLLRVVCFVRVLCFVCVCVLCCIFCLCLVRVCVFVIYVFAYVV